MERRQSRPFFIFASGLWRRVGLLADVQKLTTYNELLERIVWLRVAINNLMPVHIDANVRTDTLNRPV